MHQPTLRPRQDEHWRGGDSSRTPKVVVVG